MVVMMGVERQLARGARAEQFGEGRIAHHRMGIALATDMAVEADDPVGLRHHHMQIVADQEHAASDFVAYLRDQMIKRGLAGDVDAGQRFVEHQEIGSPGDGARE